MITIKNHDIWIDFVFSIKGELFQCKETEELDDKYTFRFEKIIGWNYPMFNVSIYRNRVSEDPIMYRIESRQWKGPLTGPVSGGHSYNVLTKDEIRDKWHIERKMLWVIENSCG
jgi:hypothetical protein